LSAAAISQIESGRRQDARLATLLALARALDVSVDHLVGGTASIEPKLLEHGALIYESEAAYLASTVPFVLDGVARGDAVLVVTARRQIRQLRAALGDDGARVEFHNSTAWYRSPGGALSSYRTYVKERVRAGAPWVRIIGEPVWVGRSQAEVAEWTRYESMINLSSASWPATIVCPYDARAVPDEILADARHTHPELAGVDDASPNTAYLEPEDFLLAVR
jgi:transcriptional regulator with XRE-family HTH domain